MNAGRDGVFFTYVLDCSLEFFIQRSDCLGGLFQKCIRLLEILDLFLASLEEVRGRLARQSIDAGELGLFDVFLSDWVDATICLCLFGNRDILVDGGFELIYERGKVRVDTEKDGFKTMRVDVLGWCLETFIDGVVERVNVGLCGSRNGRVSIISRFTSLSDDITSWFLDDGNALLYNIKTLVGVVVEKLQLRLSFLEQRLRVFIDSGSESIGMLVSESADRSRVDCTVQV